MSNKRDIELDRSQTRRVLRERQVIHDGRTNWLGHSLSEQASKLDEMLIEGATAEQLAAIRPTFHEHLHHLRTEHKLGIIEAGGVFKFDRAALGVDEQNDG